MQSRSRSGSVSSAQSAPLPSPMSFRNAGGSRGNGLGPCGATPHLFLFAQGTSILCLQYESLAVEKRFEGHLEEVTIISVDNNSDNEGEEGSRVVSVDVSKLAIVWDTRTGHEIARYNSFEDIRSAAWMKNGNLAFGDAMGNVILFDPLRSESISARTIFDPLCSIAPAADCKTFALGYANGSILVAALSPAFTILHTLTTTSLQPSPITALAWHASSSRQKSDMLATQTRDGDLRVWSVPKSLESDEPARVVRILKKLDSNRRGDNWMAWSRNGRIVQYSDGETTIWDVRTKKVTWEKVGTLQNVFGITVYGPKGVLFTLGEDHTVQQFALYPPTLLANVQHLPALPPPSPPVSIEERRMEEEPYHHVFHTEEEEDYLTATMSPLGRIAHELEQLEKMEHEHGGLGISNVQAPRTASISSRSSTGSTGTSKGNNNSGSTTSSSKGTKRSSGDQSEISQATTVSTGRKASIGSTSMNSPNRLPHPLRQEIYRSPEEEKAAIPAREEDLFASLRARLVSVTYESPRVGSPKGNMTEDDHRKEMLYCIFGWRGDIENLITDQLDSVDSRSMSAIMLRMWLGDLDQNSLAVLLGADFMVAGDWMFLALSAMGGQKSWNHVVRAFVMRLLQRGDLHTAVLCLLALGDKNDAVEVYVSHKWYMEAVLLVSLLWKKDWKRQSQLVRKWGEHCAENAEATLAARCFACAGSETPAERTTPMSRTHSRSKSETESIQNFVRGLSISAPSNPRATLRMTPKNSPLKLITTFPSPTPDPIPRSATTSPSTEGKMGGVQRFFAWAGDRTGTRTPLSATATPIAMSAISPVDGHYRRDPFAAMSAKTVIPGAAKLPPVTEMSPDTPKQHNQLPIEKLLPPQEEKGMQISSPIEARNSMGFSESRGPVAFGEHRSNNNTPAPGTVSRTVTPAPGTGSRTVTPAPGTGSRTVTPRPPSMAVAPAPPPPPPPARVASPPITIQAPPTPPMARAPTSPLPTPPLDAFNRDSGKNGPATRKPAGLAIQSVQWPPMDTVIREGTPPIPTGLMHRRTNSRNTPPVPNGRPAGRPEANDLDGFLTLLDNVNNKRMDTQRAAPRLAVRRRAESPDVRGRDRSRNDSRQRSTDRRGRQETRQEAFLMRSPSSPLPESQQARHYRDAEDEDLHEDDFEDERYYTTSPPPPRNASRRRIASRSRQRSRQRSRGRGESRRPVGSAIRSPSSPLPSSAQAQLYREQEDSFDDERYYTSSPPPRNASRARSRGRSNTRIPGQSSHMRSPSSPLPISAEALMYAKMADEYEQEERQPRRAHRAIREGSRNRLQGAGIRRSRSEHTMRQWSDQLERAGALERRPSVSGMMNRKLSIRGLPSNPRAWRNELGSPSNAGSRAASPVPHPRSASPAMSFAIAPAPPPPPSRAMSPAISTLGAVRTMSPGPRTMSPGPRQMTPGPRTMSPAPRQTTPGPRQMTPGPRQMTPGPRTFSPPPSGGSANGRGQAGSDIQSSTGLPTKETIVRLQNHYYEEPDHYDPTRKPILPDVPTMPYGGEHSRNNSASDPNFKPLIRKLPPQAPPDSPPPLPHDLPVHPALQMHLDPSQPGRKGAMTRGRSVRRVNRNEEFMNPIDGVLMDHEQSIIVGLDSSEAALRWEEENRYNQQQAQRYQQEMQQLRRHGQSPSISSQHSGHSGHSGHVQQHFGLRNSSEAIGSINQI